MTADKLEAVPVLVPGRHYFTYTFQDWDGNEYTVRLKDMGWMPLETIDTWINGDNKAPLRWGASDEDYQTLISKLPQREFETVFDAWSKDSEVSPGESEGSPASSPMNRSARRSKPTSSRSA